MRVLLLWIAAVALGVAVAALHLSSQPTEPAPVLTKPAYVATAPIPKGARLSRGAYALVVPDGYVGDDGRKPAIGWVAVRDIRPGELYAEGDFRP